jgi:hypothetical protein
MKQFIQRTLIFSLPIIFIFLPPFTILILSGENYPNIDNLIKKEQEYLIGYAYNENNYKYLKKKEIEYRETQSIIALGSSRVLQFRDKMFKDSFYNVGGTISSISAFVPFIKTNFHSKKPKLLLIALDQWMFNEKWDKLENYDKSNNKWKANFNKNAPIGVTFNVWNDLLVGKYDLNLIFSESNQQNKAGLNALVNNTGFRKDGSLLYGNQIEKLILKDNTANDFGYSDTYSRIENGISRFEYGENINKKAIIVLKDFLNYCKENDIYVVAFLPPFADGVNLKMKKSGKYKYIDKIYDNLINLFMKYEFELWDMANLSKYNSNDNETIDGFHGSEVTYIKILIYMVENGSELKRFTDITKLNNDLINKANNYSIYQN